MPHGSNIEAVGLSKGEVTINGEITDLDQYQPKLLHVWLAQPGVDQQPGAGLAIDCLAPTTGTKFDGDTFKFAVPPGVEGFVGTFVEGPATASAIAVLIPKQPNPKALPPEVLEWSRILTLPKDLNPVVVTGAAEGQEDSTSPGT